MGEAAVLSVPYKAIYQEDGVQLLVDVLSDNVVPSDEGEKRVVRMRFIAHHGGRPRFPFGLPLPAPGEEWESEARIGFQQYCWGLTPLPEGD